VSVVVGGQRLAEPTIGWPILSIIMIQKRGILVSASTVEINTIIGGSVLKQVHCISFHDGVILFL